MDMVEKVARAICRAGMGGRKLDALDRHEINNFWPYLVPEARAAIGAMREPTAWMIDEGCGSDMRDRTEPFGLHMKQIWVKMVDAALVDGPANPETAAMIDAALSDQPRPTEEKA